MENCIFCKIINHQIPSTILYEDDDVMAFLDLTQTTYGHTLVIPKKHIRNILDLDHETAKKVFTVVTSLSQKIVKATKANGVNIVSNANEIAGQSVFHFHVHIIPRYDEHDGFSFTMKANQYDLDEIKNKILG